MTLSAKRVLLRTLPIAGLFLMGGCAQEGDFGRPAPSAWNAIVDSTGAIAAREREEPSSVFPLTDDERILRDRAWRFLMPAQGRAAFTDILANLTRSRLLPPSARIDDIEGYHAELIAGPFRSPYSRYSRLSEDATADGRLIPPFAATASRVIDADGLRLRALPFSASLDDFDVRHAAMRVAENRCLIAWVRIETGLRVARYRFALEHFVVEMPGREALAAERTIAFLDDRRPILAALLPPEAEARCGLVQGAVPLAGLAPPVVAKY